LVEFPLLGQQVTVELANTLWVHAGQTIDALATPEGATRWLEAVRDRRLGDGSTLADAAGGAAVIVADPQLWDGLRRLRGSVRDLFAALAAGAAPEAVVLDELNRVSARAPSWLYAVPLEAGAPLVRRARPWPIRPAVLAALADDALALAGDPTTALIACPAPGCLALLVRDDPRRRFCGPICSNRARVARHYARHRRGPNA